MSSLIITVIAKKSTSRVTMSSPVRKRGAVNARRSNTNKNLRHPEHSISRTKKRVSRKQRVYVCESRALTMVMAARAIDDTSGICGGFVYFGMSGRVKKYHIREGTMTQPATGNLRSTRSDNIDIKIKAVHGYTELFIEFNLGTGVGTWFTGNRVTGGEHGRLHAPVQILMRGRTSTPVLSA